MPLSTLQILRNSLIETGKSISIMNINAYAKSLHPSSSCALRRNAILPAGNRLPSNRSDSRFDNRESVPLFRYVSDFGIWGAGRLLSP